jgi:hypothetical protein
VLTVNSTSPSSGVTIGVSPTDKNGAGNGTTSFTRTYNAGASVTLTAPATSGGASFASWTGCTTSTTVTCNVTLGANTTVTANYGYVLTVNSANPANGVTITVTYPPTTLATQGTTSFNLTEAAGSTLVLTAPATAGGNAFSSWTGCTTASTVTCSVTLNANTTVTANYAASTPYTLTVNSVAPSSGVSITVSPADNNGSGNGTTGFTRTYNSGTAVVLDAPINFNSYTFQSWTGCTSNPSASVCDVTVNANTTVTATYNEATVSSITVTPNTATIGAQVQFAANVQGTGSFTKGVTWSVAPPSGSTLSAGTISSSGLYITPYPAPPTVTVTATSTMAGFTNVSGSTTVTLSEPATTTGPALTVDVNTPSTPSENPHTINPQVYGVNGFFLDAASAKIANPSIVRWGGDDTSRYNYQNGNTNSASDYYFENFNGAGDMFPYGGTNSGSFPGFIAASNTVGAQTLGTVPVLGWVANNTQYACSFTQASFPGQENYENGCGNGVYADGSESCTTSGGCDLFGTGTTFAEITSISQPPPSITATTTPAPGSSSSTLTTWADATWAGGWVNSILTADGPANPASGTGKGVAVWDLDNEPTWWDAVHRDVHPVAFTYDEVTNGGIGTALAIKSADPTALVSGPVIDYWWAYFYSKKDIEAGWGTGPCYQPWSNPADRTAHGGVPMIEYYLQQFQKYSTSYNVRLLDYVDIHGYFAADYPTGSGNSVGFTTAGDTTEQMARLNSTRVFWDSTYTDASNSYAQPNYTTDSNYTSSCNPPQQAPQLIPMLQKWVANDYPGTKTGIDEYNFGGLESINGAVVQADILGIFGRQGLDLGALWPTGEYSSQGPGNYAFAMYRNYDLRNDGATFGDTYLYSTSVSGGADAENQLAVYGAQRSSDQAITIMVINKSYGSLTSTVSLQNFTATGGTGQAYVYSNANLTTIVGPTSVTVTPPAQGSTTSTITTTFPAQSITLLVVPD